MRILYLAGAGFILAIAVLRTLYIEKTIEVIPVEHTGFLNPVRDALRSFREAVSEMNRDIWGFAAVQLLYSFESPIYSVYISLYMIDIAGITEVQWGVVNSVFLPVSILLGIPAGKLVDKVQRRHSIILGYTFSAVVGLILAYRGIRLGACRFHLQGYWSDHSFSICSCAYG